MSRQDNSRRAEDAREYDTLALAKRCGATLRKASNEWIGPCPKCGGTDRFSVKPAEHVFNCRGSGAGNKGSDGGDNATMVMHLQGLSFPDALDFILGDEREQRRAPARQRDEPPPDDEPPPPWEDERAAGPVRNKDRDHELEAAAVTAGPTKIYSYQDEMATEAFQVCRYEYVDSLGQRAKTFRQRRRPRSSDDPKKVKHGFIWALKQEDMLPYRLPELIEGIAAGENIFITEGEKDADTVFDWGFTSTTFPASGKRLPLNLLATFAGANIILLQDNDPQSVDAKGQPRFHKNGTPVIPGKDFVQMIGRELYGCAKSIRVLEIPGLPLKGDVTDWRDKFGGDAEKLVDLVRTHARSWRPEKPVSKFGAVGWADLDKQGPTIEWLVDDLMTCGDKSVIGGASGSGKTFFAMSAGLHIALGWKFLGHRVKQGLVLYQAGESGRGAIGRVKAFRNHYNIRSDEHVPFQLLTKRIDLWSPETDVQSFIDEVNAWREYYVDDPLRAIFVDTLAKASVGAEENSAKEMGVVLENVDKIERATGAAIVLVHHMDSTGKKLRGSTAIYANVDQVINISLDEATKIRTVKIAKMKDDESGREFHYELMAVEIGQRADDGKTITSCVVLPVGEKSTVARASEGFKLGRPHEAEMMTALINAIATYPATPPAGINAHRGAATHIDNWKREFAKVTRITNDDDDEKTYKRKLRDAFEKCSGSFHRFNLIARENPLVWLTGKPVAGYPATKPAQPKKLVEPRANVAPDDGDLGSLLDN